MSRLEVAKRLATKFACSVAESVGVLDLVLDDEANAMVVLESAERYADSPVAVAQAVRNVFDRCALECDRQPSDFDIMLAEDGGLDVKLKGTLLHMTLTVREIRDEEGSTPPPIADGLELVDVGGGCSTLRRKLDA